MSSSQVSGTFRGTPNRRNPVPFTDSPSGIPRPKLETAASQVQSEMSGASTLSASRQKQSKRDEVCLPDPVHLVITTPDML